MSYRARPKPDSLKSNILKTKNALLNYPIQLLGRAGNIGTLTFDWEPENRQNGATIWRAIYEYAAESIIYRSAETWSLNLATTGVNLVNSTGGIVDGLAFEAGRDYLLWSFLDENLQFAGIGITRKPYSAFTGVVSGSKGSTGTFTGLSSAYQFTIGARVLIRNDVGAAPLYEYNWGTVASIVSSTSITVTLDNNAAYGTNITGATAGVILQHSRFKPWVPASSSQSLYQRHYCLLAELQTDSGSFIKKIYRSDEPERVAPPQVLTWANSAALPASFSFSREVPLWANYIKCRLSADNATGAIAFLLAGANRLDLFHPNAAAGTFSESGTVAGLPNQVFNIIAGGVFNNPQIKLESFTVAGGMVL